MGALSREKRQLYGKFISDQGGQYQGRNEKSGMIALFVRKGR